MAAIEPGLFGLDGSAVGTGHDGVGVITLGYPRLSSFVRLDGDGSGGGRLGRLLAGAHRVIRKRKPGSMSLGVTADEVNQTPCRRK